MAKPILKFPISIISFLLLMYFPASVNAQVHTISLSEYALDISQLKFKIDSFVDVRDDKEIIGLVQKGLTNTIQQAKLEHATADEFEKISKIQIKMRW
ncbi:MAG: hypothetical protein JWN56_1066 [Sphingobacteriales bacterium]|nr:hypothetical protein [Sphingobacteriales bacterium]